MLLKTLPSHTVLYFAKFHSNSFHCNCGTPWAEWIISCGILTDACLCHWRVPCLVFYITRRIPRFDIQGGLWHWEERRHWILSDRKLIPVAPARPICPFIFRDALLSYGPFWYPSQSFGPTWSVSCLPLDRLTISPGTFKFSCASWSWERLGMWDSRVSRNICNAKARNLFECSCNSFPDESLYRDHGSVDHNLDHCVPN